MNDAHLDTTEPYGIPGPAAPTGSITEDHELFSEFIAEARDRLETADRLVRKLQNSPENAELLNALYRDIHTIRGVSACLQFQEMETLTRETETLLDQVRGS